MRNLILIRHSQSQPHAAVPAPLWELTAEGRRRCEALSARLVIYHPDRIITSAEPKAIETGQITAHMMGIPCCVAHNLHEHLRATVPYFDTKTEFQQAIAALFSHPTELVFGEETGMQAQKRFSNAVESLMTAYPLDNIAIVTHGTVLSLFVSQLTGKEIFPFWQALGMPAIVAFSYPTMRLLAHENEIV